MLVTFLVLLLLHGAADARSSVWAVRSGDAIVYLGGTVHVLRASDYPLPAEFGAAYADSAALLVETDVERLKEPAVQEMMRDRLRYEDGRTLARVLSSRAYRRLQVRAEEVGLSIADFEVFRPVLIVLRLMGVALEATGIAREGVDEFFFARARADRKRVTMLETVENQVEFLRAMAEGQESEFVIQSLDELEQTRAVFEETVAAWRVGHAKHLVELLLAETQRQYPALYRALIVRRNREWLPRIEKLFDEPGREFVLVGVAHLVGEHGLLREFERIGYEVRQLREGGVGWRG